MQFSDSDLADDSPSGDATFAVLVSSFHLDFHLDFHHEFLHTQAARNVISEYLLYVQ